MKRFRKLIAAALLLPLGTVAQDWKAIFPESEAAFTQLQCNVVIRNDKGNLSATTSHLEELQFATAKTARMAGRGSIYHSSFHQLKGWDAYTRSADNRKLKVANVSTESSKADYVFFDDGKSTSFDFTGLDAGVMRHLEYTLQVPDAHMLTPFYFNRYFPVVDGELRIEFPASVEVGYQIRGVHAEKVAFSESRKRDKVTYSFRLRDAHLADRYEDAPESSWYTTHVVFYIRRYEVDGVWKPFLSSIDDLYAYSYGFLKQMPPSTGNELKQVTQDLIRNARTDREKARIIYEWVQNNIKYVAFEDGLGGFIPRPASLVMTRRFGDCKDMSSILVAMLGEAGLTAYFTWIGTRERPYRYTELPLPIVDDHMICTLKLGDQFLFLDGTDSDCIFGFPSTHIQAKEALIALNEKEYKIMEVPTVSPEKNLRNDSCFLELSPEGIKGRLRIHLTGYQASRIYGLQRYKNEKEMSTYYSERFARGNNKINFTNWKTTMAPDRADCWIAADFTLPDYARNIAGEWIVNLNLLHPYEHEEIDIPRRKSPVAYRFLNRTNYFVSLKVPPGYKISETPANEQYHNDVWGFDLNYQNRPGELTMTLKFSDEFLMLEPKQFAGWNKVLEKLYPTFKRSAVISKP